MMVAVAGACVKLVGIRGASWTNGTQDMGESKGKSQYFGLNEWSSPLSKAQLDAVGSKPEKWEPCC